MTKEVSEAPRSLLSQIRDPLFSALLHTGSLRFQNPWFWGPIFYSQVSSLFAFDYGRLEIVHPQGGLIIAISFVGYWLFYPVLAWLVSRAAEKTKWLWVVSGLLILGVSRGYLIEHLYVTSEAEAVANFLARLPGDITIGFIIVLALSELIYSSDRHVGAIRKLYEAQTLLLENRKQTSGRAVETESRLREMAEQALLGELNRIKSLLTAAAKWKEVRAVAGEISDLITNEVKPLSHKLRNKLEDFSSTKELTRVIKPLRFGRPKNVSAAKDTRIVGLYLLAMPNILLTINGLSDLEVTLASFAVSLLIVPIGLALRQLVSKMNLKNRFLNWTGIIGILILSYLPLQLLIVSFLPEHPELANLRATGLGVYLFTGISIALWRAIERSRADIELELSEMNMDVLRSTAIVEQQIWIAQKKWAYLVHGAVQGALTVAASRLQLADEKNPADTEQILKDLDKAVVALKGDWTQDQGLEAFIKETQETWDGVLSIEVSINKKSKPLLESPITARCVSEIIKELAGNAYRHGQAKRLVVAFGTNANGDLTLSASNDGSGLSNHESGLGSALFHDLTMEWSITQDKGGVNFNAILPAIYPRSESSQV
jgi:hypothetical protein